MRVRQVHRPAEHKLQSLYHSQPRSQATDPTLREPGLPIHMEVQIHAPTNQDSMPEVQMGRRC